MSKCLLGVLENSTNKCQVTDLCLLAIRYKTNWNYYHYVLSASNGIDLTNAQCVMVIYSYLTLRPLNAMTTSGELDHTGFLLSN